MTPSDTVPECVEHGVACQLMGLALRSHIRTIPAYLAGLGYMAYLATGVGRPLLGFLFSMGAIVVSIWRLSLTRRHGRTVEKTPTELRQARREVELNALLSSVCWVAAIVGVVPGLTGVDLGVVLSIIGGSVAVGVFFLSPVGRAYELLLVVQLLAVVGVCLYVGPSHYALAGLTVLFGAVMHRSATAYRQTAGLAFRSQIEAQQARRAAEQANRTKTQFFGAASHDLRQPLHAMGLFADALRQLPQSPEAARLVKGITSSVDALDELFSELLDINRVDSGVVPVVRRDFALGDLFRKIRLTCEPLAHEKGLALRMRGERCVVHADPVLVERILRNLVSNAVRYTRQGGVMVSARRRQGAVLLQVWDTGVGISEEDRQRVFEAFYQAGQAPALERRKGFGLGLSIVQRFAQLMNAPLGLRSEPGRGTVLSLTLPAGKTWVPSPQAAVVRWASSVVWLVGDPCPQRDMVAHWLHDWGAQLRVLEPATVLETLKGPNGPSRVDLLIVDRAHADCIDGVRAHCQRMVPAILLSGAGDPATLVSREQVELGIHTLPQPVAPHKLRALMAFKLGA